MKNYSSKALVVYSVAALSQLVVSSGELSAEGSPSIWAGTPCHLMRRPFSDQCKAERERLGIPANASSSNRTVEAPNNPTVAAPSSVPSTEIEAPKSTQTEVANVREASAKELAWVRIAMDDVLKDGDSAKLKNVLIITHGAKHSVCGVVNSKNSFGGYTGFSAFIGTLDTKSKIVKILSVDDDEHDISASLCAISLSP